MTQVNAEFEDSAGNPLNQAYVHVRLHPPTRNVDTTSLDMQVPQSYVTDDDGMVALELTPNTGKLANTVYFVRVIHKQLIRTQLAISVPDQGPVAINDIIAPEDAYADAELASLDFTLDDLRALANKAENAAEQAEQNAQQLQDLQDMDITQELEKMREIRDETKTIKSDVKAIKTEIEGLLAESRTLNTETEGVKEDTQALFEQTRQTADFIQSNTDDNEDILSSIQAARDEAVAAKEQAVQASDTTESMLSEVQSKAEVVVQTGWQFQGDLDLANGLPGNPSDGDVYKLSNPDKALSLDSGVIVPAGGMIIYSGGEWGALSHAI